MKYTALIAAAALSMSAAAAGAAEPPAANDPTALRVRALNPAALTLVTDAQKKSGTVRDLEQQLAGGTLVVYVQVAPLPAHGPESALTFVGASKTQRYVLISVAESAAADRQMELLAHEMVHATDIARTPWVTSDTQFQTYMSLVGWRDTSRGSGYETSAATAAERHVRREIRVQ